jgi:hypothetical protein
MPRTFSGLLGVVAEAAHLTFSIGHGTVAVLFGLLAGLFTCCALADRWSSRMMAVEEDAGPLDARGH